MGDFIADGSPFENPDDAANQTYAATPSSLGSFLGASAASGPVGELTRQSQEGAAEVQTQLRAQTPEGARMRQLLNPNPITADNQQAPNEPTQPPVPMLSPEEVKKQYDVDVKGPTSQVVAQTLGKSHADEIERDSVITRFTDAHNFATNFAAGSVGFMLDPLNAASAFVPGVGEESVAAGLGRIGLGEGAVRTTLARVGAGASAGAAAQAPLTALHAAIDPDYGIRDAFRDMAFGAAAGAVFHAGFGALGDAFKARSRMFGRPDEVVPELGNTEAPPELHQDALNIATADAATKSQAMNGAVAQMLDGRPVDVASVFDANGRGQVTPTGDPTVVDANVQAGRSPQEILADAAKQQAELYRHGYAAGIPAHEFHDTMEDVYGSANKAGTTTPGTQAADNGAAKAGAGQGEQPGPQKAEASPEEVVQTAAADRQFVEGIHNELAELDREKTASAFYGKTDDQGALDLSAAAKPPPQSLLSFLRQMGGVKEHQGELKSRGILRRYPGLLNNKTGVPLDRAREAAIEAGYPVGNYDHLERQSSATVADMVDAIDQHPFYKYGEEPVGREGGYDPVAHYEGVIYDDIIAHGELKHEDIDTQALHEAAKDVAHNGSKWEDAYEAAIMREGAEDPIIVKALEDAGEHDIPGDWAARPAATGEPGAVNGSTGGTAAEPNGVGADAGQTGQGPGNTGGQAGEVPANGEGAAGGGEAAEEPKLSPEMQDFKDRLMKLGPLDPADMAAIQDALRSVSDADDARQAYEQASSCLVEAGI